MKRRDRSASACGLAFIPVRWSCATTVASAGWAVHFGARVMAIAQAGDVLVSHTVHGILMGSRRSFAERGVYELKGVPGKWPLYAVQR